MYIGWPDFSVKSKPLDIDGVNNLNSILSKPVRGKAATTFVASINTKLPDNVLL